MNNRLLLLVLASAAALSGCVTSAGYRGHGGGYYGGSSDYYRSSRSEPYGYYGGSGSYYGYDRYGYDRYGYDRYGQSYGYPYGYAPYYNNRYYYYYPTPPRPPATGTPPPPPQLDPNRPHRDLSRYRRPQVPTAPMNDIPDAGLSRDLTRYRGLGQVAPAPDSPQQTYQQRTYQERGYQERPYQDRPYQDRAESVQSIMESPRRMRPMREMTPSPSRAPAFPSGQVAPSPASSSVLESVP
ncbi:MAG: hypothetical protein ABIO38_08095 [Luteimonas sp.]